MRKLWWMGLIGLWAFAFTQNTELPTKPKNWVTDRANLLSAEQENRLNLLLSQLERETGVEMAVVTVRRVQGTTPKQFATELFNRWGIGKKGADNGVLLLISLGDRRIEVETGYSLEAILPDSVVGAILDEQVIPRFRNGDYAGGIIAGAEAIAERVRKAQSQGAYEPTRWGVRCWCCFSSVRVRWWSWRWWHTTVPRAVLSADARCACSAKQKMTSI